jgi:hypothetical protein
MPAKYQNLLLIALLLFLVVLIYRARMQFDRPTGLCLVAWRLTYGGASLIFLTLGLMVWLESPQFGLAWAIPIGIGIAASFAGILMWTGRSCGKKSTG